MSEMVEHQDEDCWCEDSRRREVRLDRMFPGRCQIPSGDDVPSPGSRHCMLAAGHDGGCAGRMEPFGGPCHFCGRTYDGEMCQSCWTSLEGMALADIKALFALDGTFDIGGLSRPSEGGNTP